MPVETILEQLSSHVADHWIERLGSAQMLLGCLEGEVRGA